MLFQRSLEDLEDEVSSSLKELFDAVKENQTHENDLLLVDINGFVNEGTNFSGFSGFLIGPGGWEYQADHTQYEFFDYYRRQIISGSRDIFFKDFKSDQVKKDAINITTQLELMIYLKFGSQIGF